MEVLCAIGCIRIKAGEDIRITGGLTVEQDKNVIVVAAYLRKVLLVVVEPRIVPFAKGFNESVKFCYRKAERVINRIP